MISSRGPLGFPAASTPFETRSADVLIVGSGVAGLSAAVELSRIVPGRRVLLLTRNSLGGHGASPLAQGGIAAALDPLDSPYLHARDTELAADGLARPELVDILTREGPGRVRELLDLGARFDRDASGELSLGLEGAHSRPRIIHADGDRTGAEVTRTLCQAVRGAGSVEIVENFEATELLVLDGDVCGLWGRDVSGTLRVFRAAATILATGGPGRAYLKTTAPPGLEGDGMAMAARAGAELRDLEFVQFHPTALNVPTDPLPLVTEALRGTGARLVDREGNRILGPDGRDDLASRDLVARAIWIRLHEGDEAFLDARHVFSDGLGIHFPGAHRVCREHGIDPARELIPVTPAAHYHMGGVAVDQDGRTSLDGLWAVGEAAASGVHGANRLASNSLLEGMVFGPRVARSVTSNRAGLPESSGIEPRVDTEYAPRVGPPLPGEVVLRIRTLLWEHVGVVRNEEGLGAAMDELDQIAEDLGPAVPESSRNLLLSARMIAKAAHLRKESVGGHFRSDAPETKSEPRHSIVTLSSGDSARIVARLEEAEPEHLGDLRPTANRRESRSLSRTLS